jgi:hypothetical protein
VIQDYLIWAGLALLFLLMIDSPSGAKGVMSLIVTGACVWFAYWVLGTHCGGGC